MRRRSWPLSERRSPALDLILGLLRLSSSQPFSGACVSVSQSPLSWFSFIMASQQCARTFLRRVHIISLFPIDGISFFSLSILSLFINCYNWHNPFKLINFHPQLNLKVPCCNFCSLSSLFFNFLCSWKDYVSINFIYFMKCIYWYMLIFFLNPGVWIPF